MPVLNGIEAARQIAKTVARCRVLMLSSAANEDSIRELIRDGIAGYLLKQSASTDLIAAIQQIFLGKTYFSPTIAQRLLGQNRKCHSGIIKPTRERSLTRREKEVLASIALGLRNKATAKKLGISIKTVQNRRIDEICNRDGVDCVTPYPHHISRYRCGGPDSVSARFPVTPPQPSSSIGHGRSWAASVDEVRMIEVDQVRSRAARLGQAPKRSQETCEC